MKKICIIPARMNSSRFPGKPLADALGIPVVIHVAKRCGLSKNIDLVAVATCDVEIAEVCAKFGIQAIMTGDHHERCTDRVSEAVSKLKEPVKEEDLILMVQGDEILVTPKMLDDVILDYQMNNFPVTNLLSRIYNESDHGDPNVVKVVSSPDQRALYFSRSPIPSTYRDKNAVSYQQTGVIGFSASFLNKFSTLAQTPLEKIESVDMLRVLEHGLPLRVIYTETETVAVDVPYDLERARQVLSKDELVKEYA